MLAALCWCDDDNDNNNNNSSPEQLMNKWYEGYDGGGKLKCFMEKENL